MSTENNNSKVCAGADRLIFACSGAADVGHISDLTARRLTKEGIGQMFCLAGIGGRVEGIMKKTLAADSIIAIDGCPIDCTRKLLEEANITDFSHVRITDMGMDKGSSPATDERVAEAAAQCKKQLG